jgi:hypothetical protein
MIVSGIASGVASLCPLAFSSGIMLPGLLLSGKNWIVHSHLLRIHIFFSFSIRMGG